MSKSHYEMAEIILRQAVSDYDDDERQTADFEARLALVHATLAITDELAARQARDDDEKGET